MLCINIKTLLLIFILHPKYDLLFLGVQDFESRKSLPKEWRGLSREELVRVSGIEGMVFCHKTGFVASTKTREGAVKIVEQALKL